MPRYYCDYCDVFLTHDSPSVRKAHNQGKPHRNAVRAYFQQFQEEAQIIYNHQRMQTHLMQNAWFAFPPGMPPPPFPFPVPGAPPLPVPGLIPPNLPPGVPLNLPPGATPPPLPPWMSPHPMVPGAPHMPPGMLPMHPGMMGPPPMMPGYPNPMMMQPPLNPAAVQGAGGGVEAVGVKREEEVKVEKNNDGINNENNESEVPELEETEEAERRGTKRTRDEFKEGSDFVKLSSSEEVKRAKIEKEDDQS
eukprot:TRINITY_DN6423_c0_g1_i2.p2 TRINITY_DN6423_c0_g1~~TRINITY_DN6423_c0_g1_i2.p2  ORF type:complete len:249 (-),score=82.92 TRINITY_DN6423_c0_g1_i2:900-1646(-)